MVEAKAFWVSNRDSDKRIRMNECQDAFPRYTPCLRRLLDETLTHTRQATGMPMHGVAVLHAVHHVICKLCRFGRRCKPGLFASTSTLVAAGKVLAVWVRERGSEVATVANAQMYEQACCRQDYIGMRESVSGREVGKGKVCFRNENENTSDAERGGVASAAIKFILQLIGRGSRSC